MTPPLILASASPRRKALLAQINITPDDIIAAEIDESSRPGETPRDYAGRLSAEKAQAIADESPSAYILGADTVVACGKRILPKADDEASARRCLGLLSGRAHRVFSGVTLIGPDKSVRTRIVETRVRLRRLSAAALDAYLKSEEWRGKAGGYAIQGLFARHVISLNGSYSNVVGLPLYETGLMLEGAGWR